jgi:chorismate mutase
VSVRAIRGAIDVEANTKEAIQDATARLLLEVCRANRIEPSAIISIFFTQTVDLTAAYPASAARQLGWTDIPLLDAQELEIADGMPRVVRVLVHVETDLARADIRHVYLGNAANLRPDLRRDRD